MSTDRFSFLDSVFLQAEKPNMPMHVAALMQFELPEDAGPDFVANVVARFRACTVFRKPWNVVLSKPQGRRLLPESRETHDVDMEYHVRHLALPHPAGERELGQLIARLHSQAMDLRKPLWECHVIEGLSERRFAIYVKLHHALVDGVSGTRMLIRGLAPTPDAIGQLPFWATGSDEPNPPRALKKSRRSRLTLPKPASILEAAREIGHFWLSKPSSDYDFTARATPNSIVNGRIAPQRRFSTHAESLDRIKRIAKAADASLNDIVLAATGDAMRTYLQDLNALPQQGLTAAIPVSTRGAGDTSTGNAVSMIFTTLGTHIADERSRVDVIKQATRASKARLQSLSPDAQKLYPMLMFAPVLVGLSLDLAGRSKPPFNITVSNVPGGSEERYLYGARLSNLYPVSIPMHGSALNVTCYSHAGTLNFGFTACRDSVPHVQKIAVSFGQAIDRLEAIYCKPGNKSAKAA